MKRTILFGLGLVVLGGISQAQQRPIPVRPNVTTNRMLLTNQFGQVYSNRLLTTPNRSTNVAFPSGSGVVTGANGRVFRFEGNQPQVVAGTANTNLGGTNRFGGTNFGAALSTNFLPGLTNFPPGFTNFPPGFTNVPPGFTNVPGVTNLPGAATNFQARGTTNIIAPPTTNSPVVPAVPPGQAQPVFPAGRPGAAPPNAAPGQPGVRPGTRPGVAPSAPAPAPAPAPPRQP